MSHNTQSLPAILRVGPSAMNKAAETIGPQQPQTSNVDHSLADTRESQAIDELVDARKSLILQVRTMLGDPELKDWNIIRKWHEVQTNLERRLISQQTFQLRTGPIFQPISSQLIPAQKWSWKDMTKSRVEREILQRARPRNLKAAHSDAKLILYRKLKSSGREDFEYLRRLKAVEAGIRYERHSMQVTLQVLNTFTMTHATDNFAFDLPEAEPSMNDLIDQELGVRGGKTKRLPHNRLRKRGTQGMIQSMRNQTDRYDDLRILPCDMPLKNSLWKRASMLVLKKRQSSSAVQIPPVSTRFSTSTESSRQTAISWADHEVKSSHTSLSFGSLSTVSSEDTEPKTKSMLTAFPLPPTGQTKKRPSVKLSLKKRLLLFGMNLRAQIKVPNAFRGISLKK